MDSTPVVTTPEGYNLRISPLAFTASISTFLAVAVVCALTRIGFRYRYSRKLYIDDYLLLFAISCLCVAAGVAYTIQDLIYLQIYVGVGWVKPDPDFIPRMLVFEQRIQVASALVWLALYAIKGSFLVFFRKLVSRVHNVQIWWWLVLALNGACALVSIPFSLIVCSDFTMNYMVLDIFTDLLIISIPVALIYPIRLPAKRKFSIIGMLSLSVFMIAIAITRVVGAPLPTGVYDTSWVCFWQGIEAAVSVVMTSVLALKAIFGLESSRSTDGLRRSDTENNAMRMTGRSTRRTQKATVASSRWGTDRSRPYSSKQSEDTVPFQLSR